MIIYFICNIRHIWHMQYNYICHMQYTSYAIYVTYNIQFCKLNDMQYITLDQYIHLRMHARTHARTHVHTHTRTHTQTHTHTHIHIHTHNIR